VVWCGVGVWDLGDGVVGLVRGFSVGGRWMDGWRDGWMGEWIWMVELCG
jgi:hypothetical protein